jgi:hypothetical protein
MVLRFLSNCGTEWKTGENQDDAEKDFINDAALGGLEKAFRAPDGTQRGRLLLDYVSQHRNFYC